MSDADELTRFAEDLRQDVYAAAEEEGDESFRADALTRQMIADLTGAGELNDGEAVFHRTAGSAPVETSGYGLSADELTLNLFITIATFSVPAVTVAKADVESGFRRVRRFLERAVAGYYRDLEEASPVFDMAQRIHEMKDSFAAFRLFLFTDGLATVERIADTETAGRPVSYHLWDIRRLYRCVSSGQHREPIEIDFARDFGGPIECIAAPEMGDGARYRTYLVILPGPVLAEIYGRFGPRLLELNVRSFLQARGKVNRAIRRTLVDEPEDFLAYNNGISATASRVELVELPTIGLAVTRVRDFQIVNGGQTTASIYQATKKDHADIRSVAVQAKLTEVDEDQLATFVPMISRYANSQNKVSEADFSANDPFHVTLEKLSRTIWAPATDGTQRQTKWFYERARGQYQDAVGREGTPARQRQWKAVNPPSQRFTKTDLAKFENTWDQLPHLVSLGAEKNFREFTLRLAKRTGFLPDEVYFRDLVGKAVLFKRAERLVADQQYGGYRANIVTYTLAKVSYATTRRVDLDAIWRSQGISAALSDAIVAVSTVVHQVITNPPGGRNVTEWCKRPECWTQVQGAAASLPDALNDELISSSPAGARPTAGIESLTAEEQAAVEQLRHLRPETWFELSKWAAQTQNLSGWQRGLAFGLGRLAKQGRAPSRKQTEQGRIILGDARRLGFRPSDEPSWDEAIEQTIRSEDRGPLDAYI